MGTTYHFTGNTYLYRMETTQEGSVFYIDTVPNRPVEINSLLDSILEEVKADKKWIADVRSGLLSSLHSAIKHVLYDTGSRRDSDLISDVHEEDIAEFAERIFPDREYFVRVHSEESREYLERAIKDQIGALKALLRDPTEIKGYRTDKDSLLDKIVSLQSLNVDADSSD